jgi:hypothetical protein
MTTYEKIAVSLPSKAAESARRAVRQGKAKSVSAYVASAIEHKAKLDDLAALLDEMLAESGGPLTAAEKRAADRALGIPRRNGPRTSTRGGSRAPRNAARVALRNSPRKGRP